MYFAVNGEVRGKGTAPNKSTAQEMAARATLQFLGVAL